ncbi:PepSY domain-containing protein [Massilia sp. CCM 8733]|uniref:PepSY domain-containing protein n=1 Tax=Massilia mucilaginosa TaxID=2609282 RepID=A0ABX0P5J4_9BURK|nr:PepSY domain-containing protein [Massilia mucilaginosa]NHZ93702.1 PepSY domain-containing protein [Massilia mucilaginosa]
MTPTTVRRWAWIHKWTSLVCTIFMLLLCLTGLPLIFHHQIGELLGNEIVAPAMAPGTPRASVDSVIAAGLAMYPDMVMQYMSQEADDDKIWHLTVGKTRLDPDFKSIAVDARTGKVIQENKFEGTFMNIMLRLHADLFAGLWGMLFLGFMGLLFLIATVSGVVLYAPFMRKLQFGTVRRERASRLKWLDMHNLLGIVTLVWALVVGATGMINTWADLLLKYWQNDQLADMIAPYKSLPAPATLGPLQPGVDASLKLEPGMQVGFIAWPGTAFSSPHHYGIFMHGKEALTSRLYKPVLVDAATSRVTDSRDLPWYLTGLLISQPLHFGDYGGVWMQVWWALLDIATIVVLGSGLYLWRKRARAANGQLKPVAAGSAP